MCGILLYWNANAVELKDEYTEFDETILNQYFLPSIPTATSIFKELVPHIINRGPNFASIRIDAAHKMFWFSSILSLRYPLTKQSICIKDRYVLQYNGEIYNREILDNDTKFISQLLEFYKVEEVIPKLSGEFAYTIYDKETKLLFFGRDSIGKRSLSYKLDDKTKELYIVSTSGRIEGFLNCEANTIYVFDTVTFDLSSSSKIVKIPYKVTASIDKDMELLENNMDILYNKLSLAVEERVSSIQPIHQKNRHICLLFSGGLDCSIIAALICEKLKKKKDISLELLNVGFENVRTGLKPEHAPDRILALHSVEKLRSLYPTIKIKLVEIDVSYEEYNAHRQKVIELMYPKQTEMDLSIAIAFYFASRGIGFIREHDQNRTVYHRKGLVLFSGLGADELYGGYHKFANKSTTELADELTRQISNIHDRNLNRDDKVISSHGVEVRYPFLDEEVIRFSVELPINYKINKMILRQIASKKLNLDFISEEPKRAIQFGARSAKINDKSSKYGTSVIR